MKQHKITVQSILLQNERILLMKRKNTGFGDGLYGLPGGKLQVGESPQEGIQREIMEELGFNIKNESFSLSSVMHFDYPKSIGKVIYFNFLLCLDSSDVVVNNEPHKCENITFFMKNTLPTNTLEATVKTIHAYMNNTKYLEYIDNI